MSQLHTGSGIMQYYIMVRCLKFILILVPVLTCYGFYYYYFYYSLHNHEQKNHRSQIHPLKHYSTKCLEVRDTILQKPLESNITETDFWEYVNVLQKCPWEYNESEHSHLKSEFTTCCKATHRLLVTQDNAPLGHKLEYEKNPNKSIEVNEKIYRMIPKISPYIGKPFQTCAVVGNGGILLNSSCGDDIDKMDYVFRLNLPPLNVKDTGAKSDLVSANPSILIKKFQRLDERRKPFIDLVKHYGSAMILVPAFYNQLNTDLCFRVHQSLEDFNLPNKVAFFHPEYLRNLSAHWQKTGLSAKRMSSGLMLVSAAIELCKKVTLYGFWPFSQGPEGNIIPHHYYDNIKPRPGFHSMPDEFHLYTKMHLKGALYIKVGKC